MLRRSATMAGNSISGSFPHSFHQGRGGGGTGGWNFQIGPQEQMLQELAPIRPGMLGHVRKPFIRVATQEHDPLQKETVRGRSWLPEPRFTKPHETSRQTTTYRQTSKHRKSKENADPQPPQIGHTWHKSAL